jgi:hypothetical protein
MICTTDDPYVRTRLRWVAELSDGTTAYEDDGRPGADPPQAWLRLGEHCRRHGLRIVAMRLQHRTRIVELPPGKDGYYHAKLAFGVAGGESFSAYKAGYLEGGVLRVGTWKTPELEPMGEEEREPDMSSPCLIALTPPPHIT